MRQQWCVGVRDHVTLGFPNEAFHVRDVQGGRTEVELLELTRNVSNALTPNPRVDEHPPQEWYRIMRQDRLQFDYMAELVDDGL